MEKIYKTLVSHPNLKVILKKLYKGLTKIASQISCKHRDKKVP